MTEEEPLAPKVEEGKEGVRVLYEGRVLRGKGPPRFVRRVLPPPIRCPYCVHEGRVGRCRRIGSAGLPKVSLYECNECCSPDLGKPSRFNVDAS